MTNDKYILRYLPLFYKDLEEKIVYIAETLQNSKAAQELLDAVEKAILERVTNAELVLCQDLVQVKMRFSSS